MQLKYTLLFCFLLIPLLTSAAWQPNHWYAYGEFSIGTSTRGRIATSSFLNVGVRKINLSIGQITGVTGGDFYWDYDILIGRQFIFNKHFFSVLSTGFSYLAFYKNPQNSYETYYVPGIPITARFYYLPLKFLAINVQCMYNYNRIFSYGGVMGGVSLGLFNWSNIKHYNPQDEEDKYK